MLPGSVASLRSLGTFRNQSKLRSELEKLRCEPP